MGWIWIAHMVVAAAWACPQRRMVNRNSPKTTARASQRTTSGGTVGLCIGHTTYHSRSPVSCAIVRWHVHAAPVASCAVLLLATGTRWSGKGGRLSSVRMQTSTLRGGRGSTRGGGPTVAQSAHAAKQRCVAPVVDDAVACELVGIPLTVAGPCGLRRPRSLPLAANRRFH
jgi:hypothetical protein